MQIKCPTANITLNSIRLHAFSIRLEPRQGYLLTPVPLNIIQRGLGQCKRAQGEKENKANR